MVIGQMMRTTDVFASEILCELEDWNGLRDEIRVRWILSGLSVETDKAQSIRDRVTSGADGSRDGSSLEAIADLLSGHRHCPTQSEFRCVLPNETNLTHSHL
jgi:hypothetical protein